MLKKFEKYFDHYTINARFMPVFLTLLPFVLTIFAWYPSLKNFQEGLVTILVSFGVMTFISGYISNLGNSCQERLFSLWGGAPTTIIMRHRDEVLDSYTKYRYHKWIFEKVQGLELPSVEDESLDYQDADSRYRSAINYLREFTRDKDLFPYVYRDNVMFGFSRNLFAIRWFGISISLLSVLLNSYLLKDIFVFESLRLMNVASEVNLLGVIAGGVSLVSLMVFLFIINSDFVKQRAFRYAKTLLESCEFAYRG